VTHFRKLIRSVAKAAVPTGLPRFQRAILSDGNRSQLLASSFATSAYRRVVQTLHQLGGFSPEQVEECASLFRSDEFRRDLKRRNMWAGEKRGLRKAAA